MRSLKGPIRDVSARPQTGETRLEIGYRVAERLEWIARVKAEFDARLGGVIVPEMRGHADRLVVERKGLPNRWHQAVQQAGASQSAQFSEPKIASFRTATESPR